MAQGTVILHSTYSAVIMHLPFLGSLITDGGFFIFFHRRLLLLLIEANKSHPLGQLHYRPSPTFPLGVQNPPQHLSRSMASLLND